MDQTQYKESEGVTINEEIEIINEQLKECESEEKCKECNNSSCLSRRE